MEVPSGILLYGPPGTGKTLIAAAVAHESKSNFMSVNITDIVKGHVGESEKMIELIFRVARRTVPCVLFFDEFQAMFGSRDTSGSVGRKMVSQLLSEFDQKVPGLVVIAATNHHEAVDASLRRPGRFDRSVEVPLPDYNGRLEVLQGTKRTTGCWAEEIELEEISKITIGKSGADHCIRCVNELFST